MQIGCLLDPGLPGVRSMGTSVSLSARGLADLTDVTLADEFTKTILVMSIGHSKAM